MHYQGRAAGQPVPITLKRADDQGLSATSRHRVVTTAKTFEAGVEEMFLDVQDIRNLSLRAIDGP